MEVRKLKLPVGYVTPEGRFRTALLKPLTGRALLRARAKLGDNQDPSFFLDLLQETLAGFEGYTGPVEPERLFWVDADAIFRELAIWESEMSGEPLKVTRECPHCRARTESRVRLEEQRVVYVEETAFGKRPDLLIPYELTQPITTLDVDRTPFTNVKIGLLTVGDEVERMKRYAKQPGRLWAEGIRLMLVELGPKKKGDISPADVEQLSALDIRRIEALYNANEPGWKEIPPLECRYCGREFHPDPIIVYAVDFLLVPAR